jgi:hypothetical protein
MICLPVYFLEGLNMRFQRKLIDVLREEDSFTENGMVTNSSSLNNCTDFFFMAGAMRNEKEDRIIAKFYMALVEDPLWAMRLLFWARDIRGGAGERRVFRILIREIAKSHHKDLLEKNIHLIPEYGRWDDMLELLVTPLKGLAIQQIVTAIESGDKLAAKWMPRPNGSDKRKMLSSKIYNAMGISSAEYRKRIVELTNVVETKMSANEWDSIDFEKVPSLAMARYMKAFERNSKSFKIYSEKVEIGEAKVHSGAVYPYDIVKSYRNRADEGVLDVMFDSLPNYMEETNERIMPVVDVSGSMGMNISRTVKAIDISVSLGLYCSSKNEGIYKDAFITFSKRPKMQFLKGNLSERIRQLETAEWGMNTDIEAVFSLILKQARKNGITQQEMPTMVLIISDMEFDQCVINGKSINSQKMIAKKYEKHGYKLPRLVFWNLMSRHNNLPVSYDKEGTALISGFSPAILRAVLSNNIKIFNPMNIMLQVINSDRYKQITI